MSTHPTRETSCGLRGKRKSGLWKNGKRAGKLVRNNHVVLTLRLRRKLEDIWEETDERWQESVSNSAKEFYLITTYLQFSQDHPQSKTTTTTKESTLFCFQSDSIRSQFVPNRQRLFVSVKLPNIFLLCLCAGIFAFSTDIFLLFHCVSVCQKT